MQRQQSRRRVRPRFSTALYNVAVSSAIQKQQELRPSRTKVQAASMSHHLHQRESPLGQTPSTLWSSLPQGLKLLVLLIGFLTLYYFLFVKHQQYENKVKKMKELQADLEGILRKANESGFMNQNLVEAVIPAIFVEANDSRSQSNVTHSKATESLANNMDNKTSQVNVDNKFAQVEEPFNSSNDSPQKKSVKKNMKRGRKEYQKASASGAQQNKMLSADFLSDVNSPSNDTSIKNTSNPTIANQTSWESQSDNQITSGNQPSVGTEVLDPDNHFTKTSETSTTGSSTGVSYSKHDTTNSAQRSISAVDMPSKPKVEEVGTKPPRSAQYSVEERFPGLERSKISNSSSSLLLWNRKAIVNDSTSEHIFGLGNRHEHVAMYKPLCLDTNSGEGILFDGGIACGGFNRTAAWLAHYCSVMKTHSEKETLLTVQPERKSKAWLHENSESIEWVNELTVLQVLEKNCGNIAHFSGRALLLQHVIENVGSYAAPPSNIANILVLPTFHVMKRFLYPERYVHWHERLMRSLVTPARFEIGDLGSFLHRSRKAQKFNEPLVHLLHNFSLANSPFAEKKYVCFKRALLPGFLKGRFFVSDIEYPSSKPSFHLPGEDSPVIPRDSLRLRERVSALVDDTPEFKTMRKEIIFIDRGGKRRVFDESKKPKLMKVFEDVAKKHGFNFTVVTFEKRSFDEQYKAVSSASIAVGIHGANLVNTMFMPPLSVLFEVFPYGFVHDMYKNGGNAGLKYYSYQMRTGKEFEGPRTYRSPEQCVKLSQECKVHYRDSVLQVTDEDIANMARILEDAVAWVEKLPAPSKYSAESARKRRRLLRHLLDSAFMKQRRFA